MPERSTPEPLGCFGATDRVGERPRSSGPTTAWPSARVRLTKEVNAGPPKPINLNYAAAAPPSRPDRLEPHRAGETNKPKLTPRQILRHPRASPKCRREARPSPSAVLARPIALASDPVAAGRPRPGPRARVRVTKGVNAGPPKPINRNYAAAAPPRRPDRLEPHRAARNQ